MAKFVWKKEYELNDAVIDQQHQYLFNLANIIISIQGHSALVEAVMNLYKHVREHFKAEEKFLKQCQYPGYAEHVANHDLMLNLLNNMSNQVHIEQATQQDLQKFMEHWIQHIQIADGAVKQFLASR